MPEPQTPPADPTQSLRRVGAGHVGPPPGAPAIAFVATFLIGILIGPISGAGAVPSPFGPSGTVTNYFADHHAVASVGAWFLLLSSISLVFLSAVLYSRLTFLAPNASGPAITGFGGIAAGAMLAVSALVTWTLSTSAVNGQPGLVAALHYLNFLSGGPVHNGLLALLVLGLSVTTIFLNRTPRVLSIVGITIAAIDLLSTITLLTPAAAPLLPVGRFASLVWIVTVSLLLPRNRAARRPGTA